MLRFGDNMKDKYRTLEEQWSDDLETYHKLMKYKSELKDKKDEILELRSEIFKKMKIDDEQEQDNLVELIHNVVWWRIVNMSEFKTTLQLSFTPDIQEELEKQEIGEIV